jgi:hypothetical protein
MFESPLVRRPGLHEGKYDIGRVLDAALYYSRVHLILDLQFLSGLVCKLGVQGLEDLLSLPHVSADLLAPEMCGINTDSSAGYERHKPVYIRYHGQKPRDDSGGFAAMHEFLQGQPKLQTLRLLEIEQALKRCRVRTYLSLLPDEAATHSLLKSLISDRETTTRALRERAKSS